MAKTTETPSLPQQPDILALTTQIVAAHVGRNQLPLGDLPKLIGEVYRSLQGLGSGQAATEARPEPAVPIRKSVTAEYIVCLEDGRKLKMLKRHLRTTYDMSPQQYREKWGLPADYPMVAPNYAARRSEFAKQIGLGRTAAAATEQPKRQRSNSRAAGSS